MKIYFPILILLVFKTAFSVPIAFTVNPKEIHLNQPFKVTFSSPFATPPDNLFLVIDDIPFKLYNPIAHYAGDHQTLDFCIKTTQGGDDKFNQPMDYIDWLVNEKDEIRGPFYNETITSLAISDQNNVVIGRSSNPVTFMVSDVRGWSALGTWFVCFVLLFLIVFSSGLDKETITIPDPKDPSKTTTVNQPSLRMFVICFWTILVISVYIYIWIITKSIPTVTSSTLILLGLVFTTGALGTLVDPKSDTEKDTKVNFTGGNATWNKIKEWFLLLVSDSDGPKIYRFQNLAFTFIFGITFIVFGIFHFKFFVFNPTQLALMGISAASYLGLKWVTVTKLPG